MTSLTRPTISLKRRIAEQPAAPLPVTAAPLLTRFWFVWAVDGVRPKKRHASLADALTEVGRLRRIAPGRQFLVYKAVAIDEIALSATAHEPPSCGKCGGATELRRCSPGMAGFQCVECAAKASDWLPHVALADVDIDTLPAWVRRT